MNQGFQGWSMPPAFVLPYINIQDQKPQNTAAGGFTAGADQTRVLNTIVNNDNNLASLNTSTNRITLPLGKYRCFVIAPAFGVTRHQAWLQNITAGTVLVRGTSSISTGTGLNTYSICAGVFTLTIRSDIEVQHRCSATQGTNGFGVEANFGTEIYTIAEFWRLS